MSLFSFYFVSFTAFIFNCGVNIQHNLSFVKFLGIIELMRIKLVGSQYKILSRYCEDLSEVAALSTFGGYFLPSVLTTEIRPTSSEAIFGGITSLFLLSASLMFIKKGDYVRRS